MQTSSPLKYIVVAILSVVALHASAQAPDTPALQVAKQFCAWHNKNQLDRRYRSLVTPSLQDKIRKVELLEEKFHKKHPNEKGPLGDGIPFRGLPDWGICRVGNIRKTANTATIHVLYKYSRTELSSDHLLLKKELGQWKIDDVLYGGEMNRSLSRELQIVTTQKWE
ncbi:hypothetical protein PMI16_04790 [Herbaspirillum sp. CF444]|nr:hypothetical protein PMI16_04790 [Herbaspirillum sp. CF444]